MPRHLVTIETGYRPDGMGRTVRRYLCRCRCGWSEGWLTTRAAAELAKDAHQVTPFRR